MKKLIMIIICFFIALPLLYSLFDHQIDDDNLKVTKEVDISLKYIRDPQLTMNQVQTYVNIFNQMIDDTSIPVYLGIVPTYIGCCKDFEENTSLIINEEEVIGLVNDQINCQTIDFMKVFRNNNDLESLFAQKKLSHKGDQLIVNTILETMGLDCIEEKTLLNMQEKQEYSHLYNVENFNICLHDLNQDDQELIDLSNQIQVINAQGTNGNILLVQLLQSDLTPYLSTTFNQIHVVSLEEQNIDYQQYIKDNDIDQLIFVIGIIRYIDTLSNDLVVCS